MPSPHLTIAANQGELGGGEVMLLQIAEAATDLGYAVTVVAPVYPAAVAEAAETNGYEVVRLGAHGRRGYLLGLAAWDLKHRSGPLWCNGLLPAVATSGRPQRVIHLHQAPRGRVQQQARAVAVRRSRAVVLPSHDLGRRVPHTHVLPNWTRDQALSSGSRGPLRRIGFLGRLTQDKGVHVLARAVTRLMDQGEDVSLVLGGEERFSTPSDRRAVTSAVAALGGHAERLGWVDPRTFFSTVDLVVFPSVWDEPFGLVVAEAMSARVPFVITDAGALREVAGFDHPWVACRNDDVDLARVISAVRETTAERRATIADDGRRRWERLYSDDAGRERLGRLLHQLDLQ